MPRQFNETLTPEDYVQWAEKCFLRSLEANNIVNAAIWETASWNHLMCKEVYSGSSSSTNLERATTPQVERKTKHVGSVRLRARDWSAPMVAD